ncbi:hypothetical protein KUCAC02_033426 [Chaenocephalus aceratus]|nr:hypothetical protein KUCAC02_033426 [Chaenocephalus aceratus]
MDAAMVKELMDFHICHIYPDGLTSKQRFAIKRRAESFRIKGTEPLELVGMDPVGKLTVNDNLCETLAIKRSLCSPYTHRQVVPEQTGGGSAQTVGPLGDDVWCENENPADHQVQPLFSDAWEGGEVPEEVPEEYEITEEKVSSSVQMEEVFEGLKNRRQFSRR